MTVSAKFTIAPGFAVPFVHAEHPAPEEMNADLRALFLERSKDAATWRNPAPSMLPSAGVFESRFDLFSWPEKPVRALQEFCSVATFQVVGELSGYGEDERRQLEMAADAWFHVTRAGGSFGLHNHPMASWSGVYCVDSGYPAGEEPESGELEFSSPYPMSNMFADLGNSNLRAPWGIRPQQYRLKAGQLVLFPSWLLHQVRPYTGPGERVTVAFNAWFRQAQNSPKSE